MTDPPVFYIARRVLETVRQHGQHSSSSLEACGVLVGSMTPDKTTIWIEDATEPMEEDIRSYSSFRLKDRRHQEFVNSKHKVSGGTRCFLGTWHTHPEPDPSPSAKDKRGWNKCLKQNRQIPFLAFLIGGTSDIRLFAKIGTTFMNVPFEEFSSD